MTDFIHQINDGYIKLLTPFNSFSTYFLNILDIMNKNTQNFSSILEYLKFIFKNGLIEVFDIFKFIFEVKAPKFIIFDLLTGFNSSQSSFVSLSDYLECYLFSENEMNLQNNKSLNNLNEEEEKINFEKVIKFILINMKQEQKISIESYKKYLQLGVNLQQSNINLTDAFLFSCIWTPSLTQIFKLLKNEEFFTKKNDIYSKSIIKFLYEFIETINYNTLDIFKKFYLNKKDDENDEE